MLDKLFTIKELEKYAKLNDNEKRMACAQKIKQDFTLLVAVLGYRDIGRFHLKELDNMAMSSFVDTEEKVRRLWLWSRGSFKTSLITEAHSIYLILSNPNIRILVVSNTIGIASKMIQNIKYHFMTNKMFRYYFSEFCPKESKEGKIEFGTSEQFTVPNRTKALKEPTVMCAGVGTNLTGLHFDYQKIDDIVVRESVSSDTQIQASKDYYASLRQLFDNPTIPKEDVVGTTYHFNDLYSDLLQNEEFEKSIIPVATDMDFTKIAFPERFSREGLKAIINDPSIGPLEFSSQYMLQPRNPADAKFKEEWFIYYDKLPTGLAEYICCDPASTQKKKSDYTVIEKWGVDSDGKHYFMEGIRDKLRVDQRIDIITNMAKNSTNLKGVKYEVLGGRHGDLENLKRRFIGERLHISPIETKGMVASKRDRIEQRLVGQFHASMILFPHTSYYRSKFDNETKDFVKEYKLEYLQFPYSSHDDALDAHSQMFEGYLVKGSRIKVESKTDKFMELRQLAIDSRSRGRYVYGKRSKRYELPATVSPI